MKVLLLDGSILEGGGQLLRNSVALSTLLSKPINIRNVRGNRKPPGLKNQHAAGIKLAAQISGAALSGVEPGSTEVYYNPESVRVPGHYTANPGTAGSTTLLLQVSLPCVLFSSSPTTEPSTLTLLGGTNATAAPQIDYTSNVFFPFLRRHFGLELELRIKKRGYFPRGGGHIVCTVPALTRPLPALSLTERGQVLVIKGDIHVGGLSENKARAMLSGARKALLDGGVDPALIRLDARREPDDKVVGFGGGVTLFAETSGGCVIGGSAVSSKSLRPEDVGRLAAEELLKGLNEGGCVDEHLQDQMIVFLALAKGKSTVRTGPLTLHTKTAIWVAEQLTAAKFTTEEHPNGQTTITCDGIGYSLAEISNVTPDNGVDVAKESNELDVNCAVIS